MNDEAKKWLEENAKASEEKIESSAIFMAIHSKGMKESPLCALQLGIAILLNKPIAVIALDGEPVSPMLEKLAFAVEHCKSDSQDLKNVTQRIFEKADALKI